MALNYDSSTGMVTEGPAPVVNSGVPESVLATGKVPMLDSSGNPVFVKSQDVDSAVSQGFEYESPEQEKERKNAEAYGASPIKAGLLGAARTLTFGATDVLGRGLGFADALREIKQRNEVASTTGEVAGAVIPIIATLGAAAPAEAGAMAAAKGIGAAAEGATVAKGAGLLTRAAEMTAPNLITKGSEALAKKLVASGWKRAALQGGLEGAGFGAGQAVTDIALTEGDITPERVAESLISNVGMGAFMGGALSLGAYGVGKGIGKIAGPLKKKINGMLTSSENEALAGSIIPDPDKMALENTINRNNWKEVEAAFKDVGTDVGKEIDIPAQARYASKRLQAEAEELGKNKTVAGGMQAAKEDAAYQAVYKYGEKLFDGVEQTTPFDAGSALGNSLIKKAETFKEIAGKAYSEFEKTNKFIPVLESTRDRQFSFLRGIKEARLDPSGVGAAIEGAIERIKLARNVDDLKIIKSNLNKNYISPALRAGNNDTATALMKVVDVIDNLKIKSTIDAAVKNAPNKREGLAIAKKLLNEVKENDARYAKFFDITHSVFGDSGAKLSSKSIGPSQLIDMIEKMAPEKLIEKLTTKRNFRALNNFKKEFPEEFSIIQSNLLSAVKDKYTKGGELNLGAMIKELGSDKYSPESLKLLLGNQYNRVKNLKTILERAPNSFINRSGTGARSYNDSVAMSLVFNAVANLKDATTYMRLYKLPAMIESVKKTDGNINLKITNFVNRAAKQSLSAAKGGAVVIANNMQEKNYRGRIDKLEDLAANPDKILQHVLNSTSGVSDDPALQSALQTKGMQAANFLISKMPKRPDINNVFGANPTYKPSDQELSKWNRYVRAVDNPMTILDDINAGILTPESVEAVRTIYPEIYAKITSNLTDKMSQVKKPLSFQSKLQISTLMGIPVSSAMNQKSVLQMQQNINAQPQQGGKLNAGQLGKSDFSGRAQTSTNKLLGR